MYKCLICSHWGDWGWHEDCRPFEEGGCGQFQPASAAQVFFQARGIHIPDLDPKKWIESLNDGEPVAARFYHDYPSGRDWYESGSGRTRAIIHDDYLLVFDLTGEPEHQQKLMAECRTALEVVGHKVINLLDPAADEYSWPRPGQVGYFPIGSFDPLWEGGVLVGCLPTK